MFLPVILLNFLVHARLRERRIIQFIMSVLTKADEIDDDILAKDMPVFARQLRGLSNFLRGQARPMVIDAGLVYLRTQAVDVNNRTLDDLREVRAVPRRAREKTDTRLSRRDRWVAYSPR